MNPTLEWLYHTAFFWMLVIGSLGVIIFVLVRNKDTRKEKEKAD